MERENGVPGAEKRKENRLTIKMSKEYNIVENNDTKIGRTGGIYRSG